MMRLDPHERIKLATRTEAPVTPEVVKRFQNVNAIRLLHAAMGMSTEAGELLDNLKKHFFYGKPIDETNIKEEIGDMDWYISVACDVLQTTMQIIEVANIKKLAARYGEKFSEDRALLRNLEIEAGVLKEHLEHGNIQSQDQSK
jgi:NTP pyrophosphatase (non-canonical NTP hydrolase)